MEIGWIGTGIMGAPMARRLLVAGHHLRVFNRSAEKAMPLRQYGATVSPDPAAAASGTEAVFMMVPDTPDVEMVVAKIEPVLAPNQLVIDMSTIAPGSERATAARLAPRNIHCLDAPVSGGETGAIKGTLTLCNQIAVAVTLEAAAEALRLAASGGLDPSTVLEAIGAGAASSWQLKNLGPKIIARDWRPGFFIKLIRKDLRLVQEAARHSGLALPGLAMMTSMFNSASALGHDLDGTQAVAAALDRLAMVK